MGFKSKQMPLAQVRRAMHGKACLLFKLKKMKSALRNPKQTQNFKK
jgi:hypothetical protein